MLAACAFMLACLLGTLACAVCMPTTALAEGYRCSKVDVAAILATDGALHAMEQRTFDVDGQLSSVKWDLDEVMPPDASIEVNSVRLGVTIGDDTNYVWEELEEVPFQTSWRQGSAPNENAWAFDEDQNDAYVFFALADQKAIVEISYTAYNAAQIYDDTAELFWRFIGQGWGSDSENVTLAAALPVIPEHAANAYDYAQGWAHGPADGDLTIRSDGLVIFNASAIPAHEYAEVRILFPVEWLTDAPAEMREAHVGQERKGEVAAEEEEFVTQANTDRAQALIIGVVGAAVIAVAALVAIIALIVHAVGRRKKKREEARNARSRRTSRKPNAHGKHARAVDRATGGFVPLAQLEGHAVDDSFDEENAGFPEEDDELFEEDYADLDDHMADAPESSEEPDGSLEDEGSEGREAGETSTDALEDGADEILDVPLRPRKR